MTDWNLPVVPLQRDSFGETHAQGSSWTITRGRIPRGGPAQAGARLGRCLNDTVMGALKYSRQMGGCSLVPFTMGQRKWQNRKVSWRKRVCCCFSLEVLLFFFFLSSESYEKKEELGYVMRGTWTSRLFLPPLPVQLAMATSLGPGTANTGLGYAWQLLHPLFKNTKKRESVLAVNFS